MAQSTLDEPALFRLSTIHANSCNRREDPVSPDCTEIHWMLDNGLIVLSVIAIDWLLEKFLAVLSVAGRQSLPSLPE